MLFQEHQPPSFLQPYVRYYWTLQLDASVVPPSGQRILAESFEFMFNLGAPIQIVNCDAQAKHIPETGITGPMSRPMRLRCTGPIHLFGICFHPGGGYPFFKYPAHELVDQSPDVDDLWGSKGREFVAQIHDDGQTVESRIDLTNIYLASCLQSKRREDEVTQKAMETIESCKGCITIEQLAYRLGLSRRHLTRRFKERIGMTPKQLCRSIRFKQVYKRMETASHDAWADMAVTCGYYDQSHLINEFRYFTGSSPDAYFSSSTQSPDFFTANF
ncbi:MAG: helix-turn-helix domain-containing protein [Desulfobacteraceae bacterium]